MIIDKLYESVKDKGLVCVGLDTSYDYVPGWIMNSSSNLEDAILEYNYRIIDATYDAAACFKVQIAYYEAMGTAGISAYKKTLDYLKSKNCIVIADIKRGDIAKTAEMYAKAHFTGDFECDFITLNPYMGKDSIEPYMGYVKNKEKGLFVLAKTSNKGSKDFQYLKTDDGDKVYKKVIDMLKNLGMDCMGKYGYSSVGAVVGCTELEEAENIINELQNVFLLIPGYGAQGGGALNVAPLIRNNNGGIVNSSRAVLLNYRKYEDGEKRFDYYAREEVLRMRDEFNNMKFIRP